MYPSGFVRFRDLSALNFYYKYLKQKIVFEINVLYRVIDKTMKFCSKKNTLNLEHCMVTTFLKVCVVVKTCSTCREDNKFTFLWEKNTFLVMFFSFKILYVNKNPHLGYIFEIFCTFCITWISIMIHNFFVQLESIC